MGSKILAFKHWVAHHYHSTHSNYAWEVAILIRKGLPFVCHQVILDSKGQYVILHATVHGTPLFWSQFTPPPSGHGCSVL